MTNCKIVFLLFSYNVLHAVEYEIYKVPESLGKQTTCSFSFISVTSTRPILRFGYQVPQSTLCTLFRVVLKEPSASLVFCLSYEATLYLYTLKKVCSKSFCLIL